MTGIIPIDKDKDMTSFKVVSKIRGITREKKVGHGGTLDPMATGVLPVLFGGATRFLDLLPDSSKGYRAVFRLGFTSDTLDSTGTILSENSVNAKYQDVVKILPQFTGAIKQLPPMYSAVSKDGVRLYKLARQGIEIEREERDAFIEKLEIVDYDESCHEYTIDVLCSKGTYVRTICDDIGRALGCGAIMTGLRRTLALGFSCEQCITLDDAQKIKDTTNDFSSVIIPIEKALEPYPLVVVSEAQAIRFSNGGALDLDRLKEEIYDGIHRVYSEENLFLGLGESKYDLAQLVVKKLLVRRD